MSRKKIGKVIGKIMIKITINLIKPRPSANLGAFPA
jgi:hypothetical protein